MNAVRQATTGKKLFISTVPVYSKSLHKFCRWAYFKPNACEPFSRMPMWAIQKVALDPFANANSPVWLGHSPSFCSLSLDLVWSRSMFLLNPTPAFLLPPISIHDHRVWSWLIPRDTVSSLRPRDIVDQLIFHKFEVCSFSCVWQAGQFWVCYQRRFPSLRDRLQSCLWSHPGTVEALRTELLEAFSSKTLVCLPTSLGYPNSPNRPLRKFHPPMDTHQVVAGNVCFPRRPYDMALL